MMEKRMTKTNEKNNLNKNSLITIKIKILNLMNN